MLEIKCNFCGSRSIDISIDENTEIIDPKAEYKYAEENQKSLGTVRVKFRCNECNAGGEFPNLEKDYNYFLDTFITVTNPV